MNVKKYRAASTREALEKIKNDLGENALVIETKQVRRNGFLGFGVGTQIEISAAAPSETNFTASNKRKEKIPSNRILNLTDDAVAAPSFKPQKETAKDSLMAALSARATNSSIIEKEVIDDSKIVSKEFKQLIPKFEAVEISSDAPRVVHPKRETNKTPENQPVAAIETNANRELELLRAELREIKFSVSSFANRQKANVWQSEVNLDLFDEIFESPFYETYMELSETGIPNEFARTIISEIIPHYRERFFETNQLSQAALFGWVSSQVKFSPDALQSGSKTILAIIGATGVGKTTTIAKLAARAALKERRRVELVTLDTYRIAAVEQLKTYAEIIGAGCHVVRSVLELDAILSRMPEDAIVLIDTTGKNPHDLADQYELSDYLSQHKEIRKCLAVQATTHPADAIAGIRKFEMYGADSLILTKMDETLRPGAILETITESALPISYICHGQRVPEDLQMATPETLTNRILGIN